MANYQNLKAAISAAIRTNGNQEITGQVLQNVLNSIVSVIGANYTFAGVATPATNPGTPDQNVFYIATQGGTYTNFGATALPEGISLLMWNGSWTAKTIMYNDGGVFDISVYKSTGGTLAKFADLGAALGTNGANIPAAARKGGMSVKFVQSSDNKYVQYRLMADEFTTDTTQWAIADEGVYVENPEFVYVKTDKEGKILWAIKTDGGIYYGAGVPQQVIDYINEKIAELSLDEYEDIVAFLDGIINKQPIFTNKKVSIIGDSISTFAGYIPDGYPSWYPHENDRSSDVVSVNDTWWKKLIDATNSTLVVNASASGSTASSNYIGFSPRVSMLGNSDVILVALGTNDSGRSIPIGDVDFDAESYDLSQFAPAYIKGIKDTIASYPYARIICLAFDMGTEYQNVIKTIAGHYNLEYIYVGDISDVHPNKAEMQAVFEKIYNTYTLSGLLSNKVDKEEGKSLIDEDVAAGVSYEKCPEFTAVWTDKYKKIIIAIENDGNVHFGAGVPKQIIKYVEGKVAELNGDIDTIKAFFDGFTDTTLLEYLNDIYGEYIENPEYTRILTDNDGKILFAIKDDADVFFGYGCPTQIQKFVEDYINISGNSIREYLDKTYGYYIDDPEERLSIELDADKKILSYRDKDGVKHEKMLKVNHLTLTNEGMDEFQQALKDSGFQPGGGGDWSDKEVVEVPHPTRYAILNFHIDRLPKYNGEVKEGYAEYYDKLGNYFKKAVKVETQGQSSREFARTNNRGNYTLDIDDGSEIKFGSWVPQDSFHLKGTPKDITHGILATSYKWAYMFMEYLDAKPNRVLLKDSSKITTTNASGDRFTDWIDDARCLSDGFPVEIYVDGEYWGLYALQLKKHRKNYSMNKKDYTSLFIDADNLLDSDYQHGFWLDGVDSAPAGTTGKTWWNYFDIKGPKDLVCMDGSEFDGDAPKELIDSTSSFYDDTNKKHKGSAQAKAIIRGFSTKYLEVKELIDNNNIEGAKAKFNENFDYNACMLVYIFNCLMNNGDSIKKNTLWGTWKDGKIAPMLWDIDGVYGTDWWGGTCSAPGVGLWTGYATSAWPLSFMWTLYQDEIKATYAELRSHGIIDMNTWKSIVFGWANQIGTEAFDRDIERWSEMPSYRENYTNTEYWQQYGSSSAYSTYPTWDENTSYSVGNIVVIKIHPQVSWYMRYKAVKASDAQNPQPPVTKLYDACPQVGGYYDSPRRMEKWIEEQIRLCDIQNGYFEELVADFVAFRNTQSDYVIQCNNMNIDHQVSDEYQFIEGYIVRHEEEVEGQIVSTYTITGGNVTERDESKTYTNVQDAIEAASTQEVDVPSENLYYIQARAKDINYHKK